MTGKIDLGGDTALIEENGELSIYALADVEQKADGSWGPVDGATPSGALNVGELSVTAGYFQATSTDTTTDINVSGGVSIPWDSQLISDPVYSHDPANTPSDIVFNEAGLYDVSATIAQYSTTDRSNVGVVFDINGVTLEGRGGSGYIRNNQGHNHSSADLERFIEVDANDTLTVSTRILGNTGTVTMTENDSILKIRRLR